MSKFFQKTASASKNNLKIHEHCLNNSTRNPESSSGCIRRPLLKHVGRDENDARKVLAGIDQISSIFPARTMTCVPPFAHALNKRMKIFQEQSCDDQIKPPERT